jgi:hypothetical protein
MIIDKRKQLVISERTIHCRRTGVTITNRLELDEDRVPPVVEHVTMEVREPRHALVSYPDGFSMKVRSVTP